MKKVITGTLITAMMSNNVAYASEIIENFISQQVFIRYQRILIYQKNRVGWLCAKPKNFRIEKFTKFSPIR